VQLNGNGNESGSGNGNGNGNTTKPQLQALLMSGQWVKWWHGLTNESESEGCGNEGEDVGSGK